MAECCKQRKKERKEEREKEGKKERMNEKILLETSSLHIYRMPDPIPQLCRIPAVSINISFIKSQFK